MTNEARLYSAALYAAGVFFRMADADLSDEELQQAVPGPASGDGHKARTIAMLALIVHNSATSRALIRDLLHGGESGLSERDLEDIADFLDNIAGRVRANQDIRSLTELARIDLGEFTPGERRAAMLETLASHAGPDADIAAARRCIEGLVRQDVGFFRLSELAVLEILRRVDTSGTKTGKRPDGTAWLSLLGAAAKLSTSVRAFGDQKERNAKHAFEEAEKAAELRLAEAKEQALAESKMLEERRKRQGLPW